MKKKEFFITCNKLISYLQLKRADKAVGKIGSFYPYKCLTYLDFIVHL